MSHRRAAWRLRSRLVASAVGLAWTLGAVASESVGAQSVAGERRVELFGDRHAVSGGFGDWTGIGVRVTVPSGARDVWFVEALQRNAFTDAGAYMSGANQHIWNDRWYSFVSVAAGTGDFVLPDLRFDASLARKWGERRALVSTLGTTVVDAKLGYRDVGAFGSLLNAVPYQLTGWVTRRFARTPDEPATYMLLTALLVFPTTWLAMGLVGALAAGPTAGALFASLPAVTGYAALRLREALRVLGQPRPTNALVRERATLAEEIREIAPFFAASTQKSSS